MLCGLLNRKPAIVVGRSQALGLLFFIQILNNFDRGRGFAFQVSEVQMALMFCADRCNMVL